MGGFFDYLSSGASCQAPGAETFYLRQKSIALADEYFALVCSTCADTELSTVVVRETFCFGGHSVTRLLMSLTRLSSAFPPFVFVLCSSSPRSPIMSPILGGLGSLNRIICVTWRILERILNLSDDVGD